MRSFDRRAVMVFLFLPLVLLFLFVKVKTDSPDEIAPAAMQAGGDGLNDPSPPEGRAGERAIRPPMPELGKLTPEQQAEARKLLEGISSELKEMESGNTHSLKTNRYETGYGYSCIIDPPSAEDRLQFDKTRADMMAGLDGSLKAAVSSVLAAYQNDYFFPADSSKLLRLTVPDGEGSDITVFSIVSDKASVERSNGESEISMSGRSQMTLMKKIDADWRYSAIFSAAPR